MRSRWRATVTPRAFAVARALAAGCALAAGVLATGVLAVAPAHAGDATATTADGTVVVTVADTAWVEDDCMTVPVTATATVGSAVTWRADVVARRPGSGTSVGTSLIGVGAGTRTSSFFMCPTTNGSGTYDVTADATTTTYTGLDPATLSATGTTTFTLAPMPSQARITSVRLRGEGPVVRGSLTVTSAELGRSGADFEQVTVQQRPPGAADWHRMGRGLTDELGAFTVTGTAAKPAGTRFRVVYRGGTVAEPATSPVVRG